MNSHSRGTTELLSGDHWVEGGEPQAEEINNRLTDTKSYGSQTSNRHKTRSPPDNKVAYSQRRGPPGTEPPEIRRDHVNITLPGSHIGILDWETTQLTLVLQHRERNTAFSL